MRQKIRQVILCSILTVNITHHSPLTPWNISQKHSYEKAMTKFARTIIKNTTIKVKIDERASGYDGFYQNTKNLIFIAPEICHNKALLEGTLLHELGHAKRYNKLFFILTTSGTITSILHSIIAIMAIKKNTPVIILPILFSSIMSIFFLTNYLLFREEQAADAFAAKHCSSRQILESLYQDHKKNALMIQRKIIKKKDQLYRLKPNIYKKLKALRWAYYFYTDPHPWETSRAKFFQENMDTLCSQNKSQHRRKSLEEYILEELNRSKKHRHKKRKNK